MSEPSDMHTLLAVGASASIIDLWVDATDASDGHPAISGDDLKTVLGALSGLAEELKDVDWYLSGYLREVLDRAGVGALDATGDPRAVAATVSTALSEVHHRVLALAAAISAAAVAAAATVSP
jgi:hypothetical protein